VDQLLCDDDEEEEDEFIRALATVF